MVKTEQFTGDDLPQALKQAQHDLFDLLGLQIANFEAAVENNDYQSCRFSLGNQHIQFRCAKLTPKKAGQFVATWKRGIDKQAVPYHHNDQLDLLIIAMADLSGQFIFPKTVLLEKGIIAGKASSGKNGIRVYAPTDQVFNSQAIKTREWQRKYFIGYPIDQLTLNRLKELLTLT